MSDNNNQGRVDFSKFMGNSSQNNQGQGSQGSQSNDPTSSQDKSKLASLYEEVKTLLQKIQSHFQEENEFHKKKVEFHQAQIDKNNRENAEYKKQLEGLLK